MSLYRYAVENGVLVRQKRKLLRWWMWAFNRSEEDRLTMMRNELVMAREKAKLLARRIPDLEKQLDDRKRQLMDQGGTGRPFRDSYQGRKEPVVLQERVNLARKKRERKPKPVPSPLFNITPTK
jgi:hypothetical protein